VKRRRRRQPWTAAEEAFLRQQYPDQRTEKLARTLGRPRYAVYNKAATLGLRKSQAFYDSPESGIPRKGETQPGTEQYQFKKGHVPANKGLRRPGYHRGRMKETQFKKGQRPHTWHPVGTILADAEGYLRIKVRERRQGDGSGWDPKVWPIYHRYIWEQHNGPIPPKHIISFKDGDRGNCAIENLECISMADNARRNSMWANYPRELALAIQLKGRLKRRLKRAEKQNDGPAEPSV
jgi:hypothetical protein